MRCRVGPTSSAVERGEASGLDGVEPQWTGDANMN